MMPTDQRDSEPLPSVSTPLQPDPLVELAARLAKKAGGMKESELKADLLCRLGLLCWDVLGDLEAAIKYLGEAGNAHPEAVSLRLHLAISTGDQKGLRDLQREVGGELTERDAAGRFYRACAETWLFHFADMENSAQAAREGLRRNPGDLHTRAVLTLALELAGNLDGLVKHLRTASSSDLASHRRFATVVGDLMAKGEEASKTLRRLRAKAEDDPYLLERIWEIAYGDADAKLPAKDGPVALLRQKLELLEGEGEEDKECTQFLLAQSLLGSKEGAAEAMDLLDKLSESSGAWGATVALQLRRQQAISQRDLKGLAEVYWKLGARCAVPRFKVAYLTRAAELYEAEGLKDKAVESYARLLVEDPGNELAVAASERLLLQLERFRELIELYEIAGRHDTDRQHRLLERAAYIAESRLEDVAEASRLRRPAIEVKPELSSLGELGRIFRGAQDLKSLQKLYGQSVSLLREQEDKRRAGLYATAAGTVALAQGDVGGADKHLSEALTLAPDDLFAHTALLGIYRRSGKWPELVGAIKRELKFEHTGPERAGLHAEIGRIALEYLKDHPQAETHLHEAAKLNPDDPSLHHLLAQVYDAQKNYRKAIDLRRKAVAGFGSSFRAAVLLCEIGETYGRHIKDDDNAEKAYLEALELDDEMEAALDALCTLYRRKGRYGELVDMLEKRLELVDDPTEEAQLHLDLGEVAERNLRDADLALDHFRMALELDMGSALALDGLERICRQEESWDVLADALEPLAVDPMARQLLQEALERLDRWEDVRGLLEEDLDAATGAEAVGELASRLSEIYAKRFDDLAGAMTLSRRAVEATPTNLQRLETYRRLAERLESAEDLTFVYERSLELMPPEDETRPEIYRKLGRLMLNQPDRLADAARLLEEGVRASPDDRDLLDLLGAAYESQNRQDELIGLLRKRAEVAADDHDKVGVLLKTGKLHEGRGEHEEALDGYVGAFRLDPGNRDTFTLVERLCYRLKRWRDVMEVYETAIQLVENKQSRAYRLADLYARRGQLQLQYLSQTGEAAASYLKVLELDPDNDNALKFLESIFSKEGDWTGLIVAYEQRASTLTDDEKKIETLRRAARVAAAKLKDPDEAARHYESIHLLRPDDAEALDALERYFERSRNWEKLVAVLQARLKQLEGPPEMVPLHMRIGTIYEEGLRNVEEAINNYKKVLELSTGHREALEALSRIYESTEKWAEFIDITRRQIRITQDRAAKALLYFKCGSVMEAKFAKSDDAIRYYDAAIKTSSNCLPAVHGLRDLYLRREEWQKVLNTLELEVKLWQETKERAGVFARMGRIYQDHLDNVDKAVYYYESALSVDAECMPAIRSLFDISFQQNDWDRASNLSQNLSQKALREGEPAQRSDVYAKRGLVARHAGDYQQAAENLVVALEIRPENLDALDALIALCREQPTAYDFVATFKALEKVYQRRDWPAAQARVQVARGTNLEQEANLDEAIRSYGTAITLAPEDYGVLRPLVDLLIRLRRFSAALSELEGFVERAAEDEPAAIDALLRAADIYSNVMMDSRKTTAMLRAVLKRQPRHREALYRHAQELLVQGRFADAKVVCERLIDVAADPKDTAPPRELGRYYHYLGHVADQEGDQKASLSAFRRALDLCPGFPPAAIALARLQAGRDQLSQAEALLSKAARIALEQGHTADALRLRHHLAFLQAEAGNMAGALAELRAVVATGDCEPQDRLALAQLYAQEESTLPRAVEELRHVLKERPDNLAALRLLADLYPRTDPAGHARPLQVLRVLGQATEKDLARLARSESKVTPAPRVLTDELRGKHLAVEEVRGPLGQMWKAVYEHLERLYPLEGGAEGLRPFEPATDGADPREVAQILGLEEQPFEVLVARKMKRPLWITMDEVPKIVILEALLTGKPTETRFMLARALEYLRSGFSLLSRIGPRERSELAMLFKAMAKPEDQREPSANEFMGLLSRKQTRVVERVVKAAGDVIPSLDVVAWMRGIDSLMSEVALLISDDLMAAARASARLTGVETAVLQDGRIVFRAIQGGQNLLRFYLSANYYDLHAAMAEAARGAGDDV